jgi:hypothetical protein
MSAKTNKFFSLSCILINLKERLIKWEDECYRLFFISLYKFINLLLLGSYRSTMIYRTFLQFSLSVPYKEIGKIGITQASEK